MQNKDLFIFDVDGTLVDAYQAIGKSLNFTLHQFGHKPAGIQKIKRSIGHGDKNFVEFFFSRSESKKALEIYRKHHKKALIDFSRLMPDAREVLTSLKRKKKNIAVASNRPRYYTNILLDKLCIKKYFDEILCGDELKSLKPNPKILRVILKNLGIKKEKAVYIGDMDVDMEAAQRAEIDAVFVSGGSSTISSVKKYKKKKVVSGLKEILKIYN